MTFRTMRRRGVRVCVFIQELSKFASDDERSKRKSAIDLLSAWDIHVSARPLIHEKLAIIDESLFWEGSLNILSHNDSHERMTRWDDRGKASEAAEMHNLNSCNWCRSVLGAHDENDLRLIGLCIAERRKALGLMQSELAHAAKIDRAQISRIEVGRRDVRVSTLIQVCAVLKLSVRAIPEYLAVTVDSADNICKPNSRDLPLDT